MIHVCMQPNISKDDVSSALTGQGQVFKTMEQPTVPIEKESLNPSRQGIFPKYQLYWDCLVHKIVIIL